MEHAPLTISEYKPRFFIYRWPLVVATFFALAGSNTQGGHALILWFLQPFLHSAESLPPALQFAPRLWVSQQVGESPLRAAKYSLGEDRLWNRIAHQFGSDFSGHGFRVYLNLQLARATTDIRKD